MFPKNWDYDESVIRGRRSQYYQKFKGQEEILLDCIAHERPDSTSVQCVVDFLMQRWRNPLTEQEANAAAREYIATAKDYSAHWATWISPTLLTYSSKKLKPRPPPMPNIWRMNHIKETSEPQPWSRLLSLPAELRVQILEYAVHPPNTTTPFSGKSTERGIIVGSLPSLHPPIAIACRQLRHETLPIFYSTNTFIFFLDTFRSLHKSLNWLSYLTDTHCAHLQNIVLLGFDRLPLVNLWPGNLQLPHGIAMTLRRHYQLGTVRVAINLRDLTMNLETELSNGGEWLVKWEGHIAEAKDFLRGVEVGEWVLNRLVTEFGKGCEDVVLRGKRVEWMS